MADTKQKGKRRGSYAATWPNIRDTGLDRGFMERAACIGHAAFGDLSPKTTDAEWDAAQSVCQGCPVRAECLEYGVAEQERIGTSGQTWMVWGGVRGEDVQKIVRERRKRRRRELRRAQESRARG